MEYSLTCEPQRSLSPHIRVMHADHSTGRLAPEIRQKASQINHSECFGGTVRCFHIHGNRSIWERDEAYCLLSSCFFLSWGTRAIVSIRPMDCCKAWRSSSCCPFALCTAVFCLCGALSLGHGLALSPMRTTFLPECLRLHPAANPRPRPVPLCKEAFFRLRDSHELLLFFLRSSTASFTTSSSFHLPPLRHEVVPQLSTLVFSYFACHLFFCS